MGWFIVETGEVMGYRCGMCSCKWQFDLNSPSYLKNWFGYFINPSVVLVEMHPKSVILKAPCLVVGVNTVYRGCLSQPVFAFFRHMILIKILQLQFLSIISFVTQIWEYAQWQNQELWHDLNPGFAHICFFIVGCSHLDHILRVYDADIREMSTPWKCMENGSYKY